MRLSPREAQKQIRALYGVTVFPDGHVTSFGRPNHRFVRLRKNMATERPGQIHIVENVVLHWTSDGGTRAEPALSWSVLCGQNMRRRPIAAMKDFPREHLCGRCRAQVELRKALVCRSRGR